MLRFKPCLELKEGKYTGNDDDFKERIEEFNQLEYHDQIQLVKEILAAKNARLEEVVRRYLKFSIVTWQFNDRTGWINFYFSEDELTEDEVGIINELANHEQSSNIASGNG